jgi:hypothetical protein
MTIQDVLRFQDQADRYLQLSDPDRKSKLAYAIARVTKQCQAVINRYLGELEDLRVKHCLADKDGAIRRDGNNNFVFDKAGLNALNAAHRALLTKQLEDFEPYYASALPDDLSELWRAEFEGFVIRSEPEDPGDGAGRNLVTS